jgi:hypothetical protein
LRRTRDSNGPAVRVSELPNGHGRLISFFDFLREKDFIRPLTPQQIAELRENVGSVNCANCGGPVDLSKGAVCLHCGTPLSMLDMKQAEKLVAQLQKAEDRAHQPIDPTLPIELERVRRETERSFAAFPGDPIWLGDVSSTGLVGAGLMTLARWLKTPWFTP